MKEFDYIIIGGGCAGLSLAYELEVNEKLKDKTLAVIEPREDYKRDKKGKLITSVLNKKILRDIAAAGNGHYFQFSNEGHSHLDLNNAIDAMEKRKINSHEYSEYEDRYQPLTLFSFIFFIVSFLLPTRKMK